MCLIGNSWFSFQGNPTFQFLKQTYSIIFIRRNRKYSRIEFYKKNRLSYSKNRNLFQNSKEKLYRY
ncbi:hypothetical protein LEP1GSC039_2105 [Leptospira santarosai str. 2000027870]|nr:hypothetical protein LEP1GSC039_2105 [Leptospira santarosai str. 2000027870]